MKKSIRFAFLGCLALAISSCATVSKNGSKPGAVFYGIAVLTPAKGSKVSGTVKFSEAFGKVKVVGDFKGLNPKDQHGFHIHEFGDCTAADFASAGGHFNPAVHEHGAPDAASHHAGDMGNVETNEKGEAHIELELEKVSIAGKLNPLVGRAVILHENPDDLISQPTGGAGGRIACGVIGASANP